MKTRIPQLKLSSAKIVAFLRLSVVAILSLSLICLPPLQVNAQQRKEKPKRPPKPPRTDAPTIKEDLKPALATKTLPSTNLPKLDEIRNLKAESKYTKNFVEKPSTQCGFRDEICKRDKGEKKDKISQVTNRLDQMIAGHQPFSLPWLSNRSYLPAVSAAPAPMFMQPPAQNEGDKWNARLDTRNRIGLPGEDLHSGNFNWSMPLVSLPGRGGLDLGLSISYNSLVWLKSGNTIFYDLDYGFPAPGFRLGFPVLEGVTYNTVTGKNAYLLILPSGQRIELRQVGSSSYYESADSTYFQLETNYAAQTLTLRTSDGTQLRYQPYAGAYRCDQIKDANGNFLTVTYTSFGKINAITDTLGRVMNFAYDGNYHLTDITQTWAGQSHLWAHFDYENVTINTNFAGGIYYVNGPANNTTVSVLSRIITNDGARYVFVYNSYGQATHFWRYGQEDNQRAALGYLMDLPSGGVSDCPRPYLRGEWAFEWIGGWAESYFTFDPNGAVGTMTAPNGTIYKEFFATSGWQKGLPYQTETWANGIKRKWTTSTWTQDNTGVSYVMNPRVTETNVYDEASNRRRVTSGYRTIILPSGGSFTLPNKTTEYNADAATPYRSSYTDYEESSAYLSRHLLGLPKLSRLYEGDPDAPPPATATLASKVEYLYDEGGTYLQSLPAAGTQHDAAFGGSYRGNVTRVRRYDVNTNSYVENQTGYNTAGAVIFTRNALNYQTDISYNDAFSDNVNRNTFAYPTTVTDPGSNASTLQYNFDFGAITRTQDPKGAAFSREYDWAGRLTRQTNLVNQAYTRYYYAPSHYYVQSWTTVNDLNPNNEFYSITLFDGANRTRATVEDHPGSTGGLRSVYHVYDNMGRLAQQSNPTEIDLGWAPTGDDTTYVWKQQAYDWNSRPTITTNTDGTQKILEYSSCGCAGGAEVTIKDEGQTVNGVLQRRKKKITHDVFGRAFKEQAFEWDTATIYSTTISTFNVRDQVLNVKQHEGASGTFQEIVMDYDGHGRLLTRKYPIEDAATSFTYYNDDRPHSITDARGASATYSYNSRGLQTGVSYTIPSGVAATPNVSFEYDSVGKRTQMIDGQGQTNYVYDTLSRLTSETRTFTGVSGSWQLTYTYNLVGQMTSYTDVANNNTINYAYYKNGAMSAVTGSTFGGVSQYANEMKYRTWGAVKSANFGSTFNLSTSYNIRQQINEYKIAKPGGTTAAWSQYQYHTDGNIKFAQNQLNEKFDRGFSYDHAGRLAEAYSGVEARNFLNQTTNNQTWAVPYRQTYTHNVWGQVAARTANYWSSSDSFSAVFTNGRRSGWQYDAAGHVTNDTTNTYVHDAPGQNYSVQSVAQPSMISTQWLDGDGLTVKRQSSAQGSFYYLRSSALGGKVVTEVHGDTFTGTYGYGWVIGSKAKSYVYANGGLMAEQSVYSYYGVPNEYVLWQHNDPIAGSLVLSETYNGGQASVANEYDSTGIDTGFEDPANQTPPPVPDPEQPSYVGVFGGGITPGSKCRLDGMSVDCLFAFQLVRSGAAAVGPAKTIAPVYAQDNATGKRNNIGFAQWNSGDQYFHFNGGYTNSKGNWVATQAIFLWEGRNLPTITGVGIGFGYSQGPLFGPRNIGTPPSTGGADPCLGVFAGDIDYSVINDYRKDGLMSAQAHIEKGHTLPFPNAPKATYTPAEVTALALAKNKGQYAAVEVKTGFLKGNLELWLTGNKLFDHIKTLNALTFIYGSRTYDYKYQKIHGVSVPVGIRAIIFDLAAPNIPVVPNPVKTQVWHNLIFGIGSFQGVAAPATKNKLILGPDCKSVQTSFPYF